VSTGDTVRHEAPVRAGIVRHDAVGTKRPEMLSGLMHVQAMKMNASS